MKKSDMRYRHYIIIVTVFIICIMLSGCAPAPNSAFKKALSAYKSAANTPGILDNAQVPMYEASKALKRALDASSESEMTHLANIAEKKVGYAVAVAEQAIADKKRKYLEKEKQGILEDVQNTDQYSISFSQHSIIDNIPPKIIVYSQDLSRGIKLKQKKITIKGKATDESGIVEVKVDGREALLVDNEGNFTADIYLATGENQIKIKAMDRHQNVATKSFTITRDNPHPSQNNIATKISDHNGAEKRLALIIGNSKYVSGGSLPNPVNDARAVKHTLNNLNFNVMQYEDCNQKKMKKVIDIFGKELDQYDIGLFYYAGHGVQVKGINYLIPVDAKLGNENDVEYDCVRADRILAKMENAGSKANIVILDACRDNPFERSWRRSSRGRGLAFMNAPSGSIIAYATSPGATASDGIRGANGLYTSALLKYITIPDITIEDVFKKVRVNVMQQSNGTQIPWESTSLTGHFYFKKN